MARRRSWDIYGDEQPGLREALRASQLRTGPVTARDKPTRPSTFPGRRAQRLPGQLDLTDAA
jgi:hypothetical protein